MTLSEIPVVLASRSPRRIELLQQLVPRFEVVPSAVEEVIDPGKSPRENALALAEQKARDVAGNYPDCCVIGADTLVVLDGNIIGKPADAREACAILKQLSGREHEVITGVCVLYHKSARDASVSTVSIRPLSGDEIDRYVATGEPMDKAGAYAIQGEGAFMVTGYKGSYSNIVGLPLEVIKELLPQAGVNTL